MYKSPVYVLFSGGIDSTALIYFFLKQKYPVHPIYIDFGQKSIVKELSAVRKLSKHFGLRYKKIKIVGLGKIPKGELICRNAMFVCLGLMIKKKITTGLIAMGIHNGAMYPDSTKIFMETMQNILDI